MGNSIRNVAIIGAGVSGVAAAAHLKASGLEVTVFERSKTSGGVWVYDPRLPPEPTYPSVKPSLAEGAYFHISKHSKSSGNERIDSEGSENASVLHAPPGPCYELLHNNVPTGLMTLTLNSWPAETEQIVPHNILAEYIQNTAEKTGVNAVILFNTRVEQVYKEEGSWVIKTSSFEPIGDAHISRQWRFDAVIVASGHYHAPNVPDIPGLKEWKELWPDNIQHSKRYRNAKEYENNTVLLIGGSTSSTDIAKELDGIAKKIYQSTRNGKFDHPASMLPSSARRIAEVKAFNLKKLTESISKNDSIPGSITLVDGEVITNIDRYHNDSIKPSEADERIIVSDGTQMHNLHKDIFYIPDPTLAFIGVPYYTATFSLFEFQAIAVAAVFSGKSHLPREEELRREYNERVERKGTGRIFNSLKGKDADYVNELLGWINRDIVASGGKPIDGHTKEWRDQYAGLLERFKAFQIADSLDDSPGRGPTKTIAEVNVHLVE